jgi:hypothetical protein
MTRILLLGSALLFSGCATTPTPRYLSPVTGSRAAGMIIMAYEVGAFEKPVVQWSAALADATTRCQSWGYSGSDVFAIDPAVCTFYSDPASFWRGACMRWRVPVKYQCTGAL